MNTDDLKAYILMYVIGLIAAIGISSFLLTLNYCFSPDAFCVSIDGQLIIPFVKEIEILIASLFNPLVWIGGFPIAIGIYFIVVTYY